MKLYFVMWTACLLAFQSYSQNNGFCITDRLVATDVFQRDEADANRARFNMVRSDSTLIVRTVIHVVYNTEMENISDAEVIRVFNATNDLFSSLGSDSSLIQPVHHLKLHDARIKFCLAKVDPEGNPTTGITHTMTRKTAFIRDSQTTEEIKMSISDGVDPWNVDKYLNIWIGQMNGTNSNLNYGVPRPSFFPLGMDVTSGIPGVVVDVDNFTQPHGGLAFPTESILAHELGHALGLRHAFGLIDSLNMPTCDLDDLIDDTPTCSFAFDCSRQFNTCIDSLNDEVDNTSNVMNYACMQMFTPGQTEVMRQNLLNDTSGVLISTGACEPLVDVKDYNYAIDAYLYPNPAYEKVRIVVNKPIKADETQVLVINQIGQSVLPPRILKPGDDSISLSTARLSSGTFYVLIKNRFDVAVLPLVIGR